MGEGSWVAGQGLTSKGWGQKGVACPLPSQGGHTNLPSRWKLGLLDLLKVRPPLPVI